MESSNNKTEALRLNIKNIVLAYLSEYIGGTLTGDICNHLSENIKESVLDSIKIHDLL